jgi:hypothetical protein
MYVVKEQPHIFLRVIVDFVNIEWSANRKKKKEEEETHQKKQKQNMKKHNKNRNKTKFIYIYIYIYMELLIKCTEHCSFLSCFAKRDKIKCHNKQTTLPKTKQKQKIPSTCKMY